MYAVLYTKTRQVILYMVDSTVRKIRTGIPGFDTIISGGLREGRPVVLCGPPGSGKTTFGLQFLYTGARDFDEPGVFVTLSQSADEMIQDCKAFGIDLQKLIDEDKILIIDARPFKSEDDGIMFLDESLYRGENLPFSHLTQLILSSIRRVKAKRLVIDSLTVLSIHYSNKFSMRQGLQGMAQALEASGCTSLLISEQIDTENPPLEWYIASGIIMLHHIRKEDTMERAIQVIKLRGTKHSEQIFPIRLDEKGLHVLHPRLTP